MILGDVNPRKRIGEFKHIYNQFNPWTDTTKQKLKYQKSPSLSSTQIICDIFYYCKIDPSNTEQNGTAVILNVSMDIRKQDRNGPWRMRSGT